MKKKIVIRVAINGNSPPTLKKFVVDFLKLKYFKKWWGQCWGKCWGHKSQSSSSKNQSKLLSIAAKIKDLEKVAIEGEEKNELMVIGEGICAAKLVTKLRKKVGFAELVSVGPVEKKKEEKPVVPFVYGNYQMPPLQFWEVRDPYYYPFW
ncbi:heavy metal-associated isoprenylated plant protein 47-like [Solanum dulcamara]|uniref:heavy metal-associated isoprenylated plant protein 47-like n=1 Tax=Solanum dulcamara TaxID=45834 RepID=UPI0024852958|nr:heavy metal-associated isoprenylated plant protein 47-like [Solanum dulcamara]